MRSRAIGDDDDPDRTLFGSRFGDQAPAAETFVIGVGRDNHKAADPEALLSVEKAKACAPSRSSPAFNWTPQIRHAVTCSSTHAAALVRARSGPGWRRYVARSRRLLDRVRAHKSGQPDGFR